MVMRQLPVRPHPIAAPLLPDGLPAFLKLVAEPNRLRILALLMGGELCVCDIEAAVGLPQNLVSHHLSVLRHEGLVQDRREGKWVYYSVEAQTLGERLGALTLILDTRQARRRAAACRSEEGTP